jgi:flagellar protein FliO/FliZ
MKNQMRISAAVVLTAVAVCVLAFPALAEDAGEQPSLFITSVKTLGALLLILAIIIIAAWAARKYLHFLPKSSGKGDEIQILSIRALGPKRSVYLLEVEGQKILVGASDGGINLLKEFHHDHVEK